MTLAARSTALLRLQEEVLGLVMDSLGDFSLWLLGGSCCVPV